MSTLRSGVRRLVMTPIAARPWPGWLPSRAAAPLSACARAGRSGGERNSSTSWARGRKTGPAPKSRPPLLLPARAQAVKGAAARDGSHPSQGRAAIGVITSRLTPDLSVDIDQHLFCGTHVIEHSQNEAVNQPVRRIV